MSAKGVIFEDTYTDRQMLIALVPANYGTSRVKVDDQMHRILSR